MGKVLSSSVVCHIDQILGKTENIDGTQMSFAIGLVIINIFYEKSTLDGNMTNVMTVPISNVKCPLTK